MKQSILPINKAGGAGAEGFLDVKSAAGDPHKIIITLSNLFTTPLATGVPFNWRDLTPVQMLALDNFVLWVNAKTPYKNAKEFVEAAKKAGPGKMKMGGTGAKQEDQIITVAIEQKTGAKFTYIPFKGGGAVATQLVGGHVDSTVNNPIEAVAQWRGGNLRPLCVFEQKRLPYKEKVTDKMALERHPDLQGSGPRRRLPDAARHLHAAGREARARRLLHRPVQEGDGDAGVEEADGGGRVQHHRARRPAVRRLGGARKRRATSQLMKAAGFIAGRTVAGDEREGWRRARPAFRTEERRARGRGALLHFRRAS